VNGLDDCFWPFGESALKNHHHTFDTAQSAAAKAFSSSSEPVTTREDRDLHRGKLQLKITLYGRAALTA
jgi:hypothetical protein